MVRIMKTHICQQCNREYKSYAYDIEKRNRKFCSHKCLGLYQRNKPRSAETKKKIRLKAIGRKASRITRQKMSVARKKRVGVLCPNWKGGKVNWLTMETKIRDNYTCQICGFRDPDIMEVDHIKPKSLYPELESALENLVTLCPNCHRRKTIRDWKLIRPPKINK
ncbi:MAG: hypothetical protein A2W47_04505 [Gammaproteobacteria bacterium RIFCSPHIGHO2_12_38_15]|nr:MAG: hypothetical protein A2W47_04505 [Gammaproteobacteria bacterium RIFCSPHIGHO2_12_38_15]